MPLWFDEPGLHYYAGRVPAARGITVAKGMRLELVVLARNLPETRDKPEVLR